MTKNRAHHVWRYFKKIHPWYFLVLTIVSGSICLVALRHNNEQMLRLRDAVYAADKNDGDVTGALRNLQGYVYSHMNTDLASGPNAVHPPIQLKYTYERKVAAQPKQTPTNGVQITPVPDALYKFDFAAAKWSPDLAGWSLLATIFFALCFLVSASYRWLEKHELA